MAVGGKVNFEVYDGAFIDQRENCDMCNTREHEGYCSKCELYICQICYENHIKSKSCRDHELLQDSHKSITHESAICFETCDEHKQQDIKAYCTEHKCCVCIECILLHHKSCAWEYIIDASNRFQNSGDLARLLEKVQSLEYTLDKCMETIDEHTKLVETINKVVISNIESFTKSLVEYVEGSTQQVLDDAKVRESAHQHKLDKMKVDIQSLGSQVEEIITNFRNEDMLHKRFILAVETLPQVARLQDELAAIDCDNVINDYTFQPLKILKRMVCNKLPIGRLTDARHLEEDEEDDDDTKLKKERERRKGLKQQLEENQNFEEKGEQILQHPLDNSPKGYTDDKMSHRLNNQDRMLAAVGKLENVQDKVVFLSTREYVWKAAKTYEDNNEWENAVSLMLIHGFVDEAVDIARKSLQDDIIAHTLLVACRRSMSKVKKNGHDENMEEVPKESLRQDLEEVGKLYDSKHDNDHVGEVAVLQARLCYDFESVKRGWKAFLNSKPFPNEPGLLECCDLLVQSGDHGNIEVIQLIVRGIKYLFRVCKTFQDNSNKSDRNKIMKYYQLYGLEYSSQDKLVIHPKLKPVFLQMSHSLKIDKKKIEVEVDRIKAHDSIVDYLLQRGAPWLEKVQDLLENIREERLECGYHVAGVECDETDNVDNPCRRIHSTMTQESFRQLIDIDLLMIEFEKVVMDGMSDLTQKNDVSMKSLVDRLNLEDKDSCVRYKACLQLWDDLMPAACHPLFINTDSRKLIAYLRKNDQVVTHFKNFLVGRWAMFTSGRYRFHSKAVKETETYLVLQFGYYLFGLDAGKVKLSQSPIKEIATLENDLDREVASKQSLYKERNSFTLMMDRDVHGRILVICAARRFVDALQCLETSSPNPVEAVMKFSKFQMQLSKRKDPMGKFYPELKHYLLWLEFFTSLSIMIIAKLKTKNFADFTFFLPNNYHALLHFIEASFPSSAFPVEETVAWWEPASHKKMKVMDLVSERLKGFTFVISGHAQFVKILDKILGRCSKELKDLALLERFLILGMTMICNIGQAVPIESELSLLSTLSHIELPDGASDRIKHTICLVKKCTGISGIAKVLIDLLDKRQQKESLMVCRWRLGKKSRIEKVPFQDYKNLQDSFYNMKTLLAMEASHVITEPMKMDETLEELQDEEEIQKGIRDKQAQLEEDWLKKKTEAATFIQRTFKAFLDRKKKKREKDTGTDTRSDVDAIFENMKIDDKMCGVCGYSFGNRVKNILYAKESILVGGQSVWNTGKAEEPWAQPLQTTLEGGHVSSNTKVDVVSANSTDMLLQKVKNYHFEDSEHIKKCQDLNKFKVKYIEEIEPNHRMVRQFLDNPDYKLSDDNFVRKHYGQEAIHIERLKSVCLKLQTELNLLMSRPAWNEMQAFLIDGTMSQLMKTFNYIETYIKDVHRRWTQFPQRPLS